MRIGYDIGPITRSRSGVGSACLYLLRHLVPMATDCHFRGFAAGVAPLDVKALPSGLTYRRFPVPTRMAYKLWRLLHVPKVDTYLGGVDVYHATNFFLPPTARARRVVTVHDLSFLLVPELCSPKIVPVFSEGIRAFLEDAQE